eukprot:580041-Prymnesium_polylepis.2
MGVFCIGQASQNYEITKQQSWGLNRLSVKREYVTGNGRYAGQRPETRVRCTQHRFVQPPRGRVHCNGRPAFSVTVLAPSQCRLAPRDTVHDCLRLTRKLVGTAVAVTVDAPARAWSVNGSRRPAGALWRAASCAAAPQRHGVLNLRNGCTRCAVVLRCLGVGRRWGRSRVRVPAPRPRVEWAA